MKIRWFILILILFFWGPYGCTLLIPEHETKTKAEFYEDKAACDREARIYVDSQNRYYSDSSMAEEELRYTRRCLKKKGWRYFK